MKTLLSAVLFLVATLTPAFSVRAQSSADRGAFILIQRNDTIDIERFARTADSLSVDMVVKMQARFVYVARLAKDFTISQMTIQVYPPTAAPDGPAAQTALLTMKGDTAIAEIRAGGQSQTQRIKTV